MSQLTFKLINPPASPLDLSPLTPSALTGKSSPEIEKIPLATGATPIRVGDIFRLTGTSGGNLWFEGGSALFDNVGAGLANGTISIEGDAGANAGRGMKGGRLEIEGNTGPYLASGMSGGIIAVCGSAGDFVGGVASGKRFGMTGGSVVIEGNSGSRTGDKMRRGLILVRGKTGDAAGSRMVGGTIVAEGGFGPHAGQLMRRGTLIGPSVERMSSTFADCGLHELVILNLMSRAWTRELGELAPIRFPAKVRRYAGDLATIGKGEILLTA
jgi:formylmethanofuran dehydrogenase subunit C